MPDRAVEVECAGVRIALLAERAAWWADARTLLVADVHLGKPEALGAQGAAVPSATNHEALDRLGGLVAALGARRVVVLGDLLHAPAGLTERLGEDVGRWRAGVRAEMVLVPGNHDRRIEDVAERWGFVVAPAVWRDGPWLFVHDAEALGAAERPSGFVWSGHVHPVARLRGGGHALRLPCFVVGQRGAMLPAFSRFTGGVAVRARAGERLYACAEDVVIAAPPENRVSTRATNSR